MKDNTVPLTLISLLADGEFHSGEHLGETLGMSRAAINKHVQTLRDWGVDVFTVPEGMGHAEAAAGGVDTSDVNPRTLESRKQPGLYFAGEVLDVTGLLGGYNLHWAWASGKAVGESWKK